MERVWSTLRRGFSAQSIFMFVLTVFITALLFVIFGSQTQTHAAGPVANWVGNTIVYDGHTYNANTKAKENNTLGFPVDTTYYTYAPASTSSTGTQPTKVKAFVIYFAPGADPPSLTTATFITYDYLPSTGYSNPSGKKSIEMTPSANTQPISSCSVEGIGWIICPVTVFLASGMDFIFEQVATFMAVQPLTTSTTSSSLYIAWNIMRSVANVAFIIVFMIIIYSQLTNAAVSNYGIKKLLPRLIVAALLVNLSYIICSIAIDISNILGYSLQQIFINIRENTFSITNDTWSAGTTAWTTVTAVVLSGVGIGAVIADPGVLFALIPVLLGVFLTALVVLLILAARQAIIIILIILAPLAFVAYLLPNTEQWFKKWRELFMTMLIFFPALSLVFGGSQLASSIILQNASSMMMIVFGLAVQVAPLVITPIILRFSGGVLGKIAGIVNDPKKGIMDRTNAWTKDRRDRSRGAMLANKNTKNPFRRVAQTFDNSNRKVKEQTELYGVMADNRYNQTKSHEKIHTSMDSAKLEKEIIDNKLKAHTLHESTTLGTKLNLQSVMLEETKVEVEVYTKTSEKMYAEYRAGKYVTGGNTRLDALQKSMAARVIDTSVEASATEQARTDLQITIAEALKNSATLRTRAGGVRPLGADSVLASAIAAVQKADAEDIKNIQEAADIVPGDLTAMSAKLASAITSGQKVHAQAYQNMLLKAGGAGISKFRETITSVGPMAVDVQESLRGNLLDNHPQVKAKANDINEWAVAGGSILAVGQSTATWAGMTDEDIATQHPSSLRLMATTGAISRQRAQSILKAEALKTKLNDDAKKALESIL